MLPIALVVVDDADVAVVVAFDGATASDAPDDAFGDIRRYHLNAAAAFPAVLGGYAVVVDRAAIDTSVAVVEGDADGRATEAGYGSDFRDNTEEAAASSFTNDVVVVVAVDGATASDAPDPAVADHGSASARPSTTSASGGRTCSAVVVAVLERLLLLLLNDFRLLRRCFALSKALPSEAVADDSHHRSPSKVSPASSRRKSRASEPGE